MEKVQDKKEPTEAEIKQMQEAYIALQKKKQECWNKLMPIMKEYNYQFECKVLIDSNAKIRFDIDLVEGAQEGPAKV